MSGDLHIDSNSKGIAAEMEILHHLEGEAYWKQLKVITERKEFKPVEKGIYSAAGQTDPDFPRLLDVAKKAAAQGFQVFILPNPKEFKSADLILVRNGIYQMFDVKSITGKNSILTQLISSSEQASMVILNLCSTINPRKLSVSIRRYFDKCYSARKVIVFKGKRMIVVDRQAAETKTFILDFCKSFREQK